MPIETMMRGDTIFFKVADIVKVLGIDVSTASKWFERDWFDEDENTILTNCQIGGKPRKFVAESGLYRILNRTNSTKARPFERWVTKEVLPSIRKTGSYSTQQKKPQTYAEALLESGRLALELEKTQTQLAQAKPKIEFADSIMENSQAISVCDFAKLLSKNGFEIGQKRLFEWLRQKEYINERNIPYQQYIKQGLFSLIEESYSVSVYSRIYLKTLITGKGQIYFCEKIRKEFAKI